MRLYVFGKSPFVAERVLRLRNPRFRSTVSDIMETLGEVPRKVFSILKLYIVQTLSTNCYMLEYRISPAFSGRKHLI